MLRRYFGIFIVVCLSSGSLWASAECSSALIRLYHYLTMGEPFGHDFPMKWVGSYERLRVITLGELASEPVMSARSISDLQVKSDGFFSIGKDGKTYRCNLDPTGREHWYVLKTHELDKVTNFSFKQRPQAIVGLSADVVASAVRQGVKSYAVVRLKDSGAQLPAEIGGLLVPPPKQAAAVDFMDLVTRSADDADELVRVRIPFDKVESVIFSNSKTTYVGEPEKPVGRNH